MPRVFPFILSLLMAPGFAAAQLWPVAPAFNANAANAGNDAQSGQNFASRVAISGDWVAVAAISARIEGRDSQGAVYLYQRIDAGYAPVQRLTLSDGLGGDLFGSGLALHGDWLLVGAPGRDIGGENNRGLVAVYRLQDGRFVEVQRLTGTGTDAEDRYGSTLAFDGQTLAVGAPNAAVAGIADVGAAYVHDRLANGFASGQRLEPVNRSSGDAFGFALAVDGGTVAVGAPVADISPYTDSGSVTVFTRVAGSFTLQQTLQLSGRDSHDWFGWALALSGDRLFVGAPFDDWITIDRGSVQPFARSAGVWSGGALIQAPDAATQDLFGFSVVAAADDLWIGARDDQVSLSKQGSVYQFRGPGAYSFQRKLLDPEPGATDFFGHSLAIDAGTLLVGSRLDDLPARIDAGSALVFADAASQPQLLVRLTATLLPVAGEFGQVLAASGDDAFVGVPDAAQSGVGATGAVDWFRRDALGNWQFRQRFLAPDGQAGDRFGAALAAELDTVLIGAPGATEQGQVGAGVVYLLRRQGDGFTLMPRQRGGPVQAGSGFGSALSLRAGRALIGMPKASVDGQAERGLVMQAELSATGLVFTVALSDSNGAEGDRFGSALADAGGHVAIAAPFADVAMAADAGKLLLSARTPEALTSLGEVHAEQPQAEANFGAVLASSARLLAIGTPNTDLAGNTDSGQLSWIEWSAPTVLRTVPVPAPTAMARFASALAVHGGIVLVASERASVGDVQGAGQVSVWMLNGAELGPIGTLVSAQPQTDAGFGSALSFSGNRALIAAAWADVESATGLRLPDAGQVHAYEPDAELILGIDNAREILIHDHSELATVLIANTGSQPAAEIALSVPLPEGLGEVQWTCIALGTAACPSQTLPASLDLPIDLPPASGLRFERQSRVLAAPGAVVLSEASALASDLSADDPVDNSDQDLDPVFSDRLLVDGFESP